MLQERGLVRRIPPHTWMISTRLQISHLPSWRPHAFSSMCGTQTGIPYYLLGKKWLGVLVILRKQGFSNLLHYHSKARSWIRSSQAPHSWTVVLNWTAHLTSPHCDLFLKRTIIKNSQGAPVKHIVTWKMYLCLYCICSGFHEYLNKKQETVKESILRSGLMYNFTLPVSRWHFGMKLNFLLE